MTSRFAVPLWIAALLAVAALDFPAAGQAKSPDPTREEVFLPAAGGWRATLVHDAGVGIWTVKSYPIYARFGCPEIVGLDDKGRCTVLIGYSGKWSPVETVHDGYWLGGLAHADLDPRRAGPELYTGGQRGRLYQIHQRPEGGFETRIATDFPGEEIHTLVGGVLGPPGSKPVLLVFLGAGGVFQVSARPAPDEGFDVVRVAQLPGRVRDAVVLDPEPGHGPWIATVSRAGEVALYRLADRELERRVILTEPMGFGRLARKRVRPGEPTVLYVTRDDGLVLRLEHEGESRWKREVIYAGPQGPRGVVAGRFHEDPEVETVAVFGYSRNVQLLSRRPGRPWQAETVFTDVDKGHWLAAAELDGRNATDEILGSGYGGRIFLLTRPPAYGSPNVPVDPEPAAGKSEARAGEPEGEAPIRVAVESRPVMPEGLTPLRYTGAFEAKAILYETLVRRDAEGKIVPDLAASWSLEEGGRVQVFTLRPGARFHDGTPVTAEAVELHFRRWVGLPEHGWLGASRHIREVRALGPDRVRIELDRPYALLPDLCSFNPCAIPGPGSINRHGTFVRPIGSGPFRFVSAEDGGRVLRYARWRGSEDGTRPARKIALVHFQKNALAALLRGEVDLLVDGWATHVSRDRLAQITDDPGHFVVESPGSAVVHLNFNLERRATRDRELRRQVAARVDREALVREVERGHAVPCRSWAAPTVKIWPASRVRAEPAASLPELPTPLVLIARSADESEMRLANALRDQLGPAGLAVEIRALDDDAHRTALAAGEWDLSLDRTWGVPYDPYITLLARFLPVDRPSAGSHKFLGATPELAALVEEATRHPELEGRLPVYRRIQDWLDREAILVPLYCPDRIAAVRTGLPAPVLGHDLYRLDLTPLTDRS